MYMCMHVHVYIEIYMYIFMYNYEYIYIYICIFLYICIFMYICTYMYIYVYTYTIYQPNSQPINMNINTNLKHRPHRSFKGILQAGVSTVGCRILGRILNLFRLDIMA